MANSRKKMLNTGGWVELTAGAVPTGYFQWTNLGPVDLVVQYAAAIPSASVPATEPGDIYKMGEGDRPPLAGTTLRAWARVAVPYTAAQLVGTQPSDSGSGYAEVTLP